MHCITMLKDIFHYSNQTCIKLVPILFFLIIDPSINNVAENAMESSIHDGSKNPTQIQTRMIQKSKHYR